jgi:hypothetical protein
MLVAYHTYDKLARYYIKYLVIPVTGGLLMRNLITLIRLTVKGMTVDYHMDFHRMGFHTAMLTYNTFCIIL